MRQIYEGLGILLKYGEGEINPEHYGIFAGSDDARPENMTKEDLQKLDALEWSYKDHVGWYHNV